MLVYAMGAQLEERTLDEVLALKIPAVFLVSSDQCREVLEKSGIRFEGEINMEETYFCKVEAQQNCIYGTLVVPKLLDVLGERYKIQFFVNESHIVIASDDNFAKKLIERIQRRKVEQGSTKERFLYNFISEFMNRDLSLLNRYERHIMRMEDDIMHDEMEDFQDKLMPLRKELMTLRGYYDELCDLCQELEENENGFFKKKQLSYFGTLNNRADRLMNKTMHLIEYLMQVRDVYQSKVDEQQNRNMQYLTVVSTIFFPLTLITGWYGMNFHNMPELTHGYPGVIALSIIVVIACVGIFKWKKII